MSASRASLTRLWNYRGQASGIVPGSAGAGWPARIGGGARGIGAILQQRGAGGADGEGSHDEHSVPGDRGVSRVALVEAEAILCDRRDST
jgi:hypothetical protein